MRFAGIPILEMRSDGLTIPKLVDKVGKLHLAIRIGVLKRFPWWLSFLSLLNGILPYFRAASSKQAMSDLLRSSVAVLLGIRPDGHCPLGLNRQPRKKRSPLCESWVGAIDPLRPFELPDSRH
jgi:hypothetical protein